MNSLYLVRILNANKLGKTSLRAAIVPAASAEAAMDATRDFWKQSVVVPGTESDNPSTVRAQYGQITAVELNDSAFEDGALKIYGPAHLAAERSPLPL